ncbi:CopD family protein [Gymnodinialimonas sp. 57CJ19]|uniref:copper resistance D family protein n=1 Tax=Gymnodinialimonas sp. 57CJ19 TaxID=3138498 RepID=UPI0031343AA8
MPDIWGQVAIIIKLCLYLSVLTATGLVMVRVVFANQLGDTPLAIRKTTAVAAAIGLGAAGLAFAVRGAALTGDASGITDPQILGILWQTPVGTVLSLRVIGLGLILIGLMTGQLGKWVALAGTALVLWSFAQIGHLSGAVTGMKVLLVVHLAGVAFWIGVLSPLRRLASNPLYLSQAATLGHRFGQIATIVVPVLIGAGVFHAWKLTGSWANLIGSAYGQTLSAKIALVSLLLGLAAANKLRFVPQLAAGDTQAARHLSLSISVEWVAIVAILLATSIFTSILPVPT